MCVNARYVLIEEPLARKTLAVTHRMFQNSDAAFYFKININGNKANKDTIVKTKLAQKCNSELLCTIEKKRE